LFAGGWTLEAAEEVCAGEGIEERYVLDLLTSLADKSLVVPEQEDAQTRCRLLETVRQYARDRLEDSGGTAAVRVRHRDYYLALGEEADPKLRGAEEAEWLRRLEEEHENLRAGLEWSLVEAGSKGGLRLCGALQRFWWTHGHFAEGRRWCTRVLCKAGAEERTRERASALNAAGILTYYQGDYPAARALYEESLAIRREVADRLGIAASLSNLGYALLNPVDYPAARAPLEESLAICRELGDRFVSALALSNLGYVALNHGDYPAARALLEESLEIRRKLGDRSGIPYSLEGLAAVVASLLGSLRAARIWGATERWRAEIGAPLPPCERSCYDRLVAAARIASGDEAAFDNAWQEGRGLTLDQAIDLALAKPIERG
jgi:non-specific serine/threonine protein kinase